MAITYSETQEFEPDALQDLFLAVEWEVGNYPDRLVVALANSDTVYSAWDADRLIGLINALDDGVLTAYVHFLLVHPDYQSQGIGKELMRRMIAQYQDVLRMVLTADDSEAEFYQKMGLRPSQGTIMLGGTI